MFAAPVENMGTGALAGIALAVDSCSEDELRDTLAGLSEEQRQKLSKVLEFHSGATQGLVRRTPPSFELLRSIHSGEQSCVAVCKALFDRINQVNSQLKACVEVLDERALKLAAEVDNKVKEGSKLRPLEGLPLLVKANIDMEGTLSTAATPGLQNWRPRTSSPCVMKLSEAGAIVIAKTNMPEMALRMDGYNKVHGMCCNPYTLEHSPGGSSSGTAAGIASGMAPAGLGSDTGGSLRIPAACCGIVGFRPSRGRWPQSGVVPIDHTKDTAGPMGGSVSDVALLDSVVTGSGQLEAADLKKIKVGIPQDWIDTYQSVDEVCQKGLEQAISALQKSGATVETISDFTKIVGMMPKMAPGDHYNDLASYLDSHADRPENISVNNVVENITNPMIKMAFSQPQDPEAHKIKMAEIDEGIAKQETAYHEYFKERGLQALLLPTMPVGPCPVSETDPTPMIDMIKGMGFFCPAMTQLKTPSISIPTKVCLPIGSPFLPVSVMLLGVDDRELLSIAWSLEQALV